LAEGVIQLSHSLQLLSLLNNEGNSKGSEKRKLIVMKGRTNTHISTSKSKDKFQKKKKKKKNHICLKSKEQ